ncbi:MAG: DUF423 domain-containing protein [Aureliella sp.]
MIRWIVIAAGILGAVGVMIGAYGAHGLEKSLAEQNLASDEVAKKLAQCETAVRYHMVHVLALLSIGLSAGACRKKRTFASIFFLLGITLFSGGLYSMVFADQIGHWAIVPSGGLCFMVAWISVILFAFGGREGASPTTSS